MRNLLFLFIFSTYIYAYTGSFTLPMIGACDNFIAVCNGDLYIVWTNWGYAGSCASNDGMVLVASNVVSASCPGASYGVVCRGPGSNCYGQGSGEDYYYTDCPQACTYTTSEPEPPDPNCAVTDSAAQILLSSRQASCDSLDGDYFGGVVHKENGDWCVEDSCILDDCPDGTGGSSFLQKRSVSEKSTERFLPNEKSADYRNKADYSRGKPAQFYDALGRRTEPRPETRRRLFEAKKDKTVTKVEPDIEGILKRQGQIGECCVKSFSVNLIDAYSSLGDHDKFGIYVGFNAEFHEEGYNNNYDCNPACCEYKQETRGWIIKNGEDLTEASCKANGQPVYLKPFSYVPDCYGRGCGNADGQDKYNDSLGTYNATDFPGLKDVKQGDTLNMRMEFNSFIKDRCNNYETKSGIIPWGFRMHGIVPAYTDSLEVIPLGVLAQ